MSILRKSSIKQYVDARLMGAPEDRIRASARGKRRRSVIGHAMDAGLGIVLIKLVVGLAIVLSLTGALNSVLRPFQQALAGGGAAAPQGDALPVTQQVPNTGVVPTANLPVAERIEGSSQQKPTYRPPTAEEVRESTPQAGDAMRNVERTTPEL